MGLQCDAVLDLVALLSINPSGLPSLSSSTLSPRAVRAGYYLFAPPPDPFSALSHSTLSLTRISGQEEREGTFSRVPSYSNSQEALEAPFLPCAFQP